MKNASSDRSAIVLTDVSGKHYWTEDGMFIERNDSFPLPSIVRTFATAGDADREIAVQLADGIHLVRHVVADSR